MSKSINIELKTSIETSAEKPYKQLFEQQDEMIMIDNFLPETSLQPIIENLAKVEDQVNRNFIPNFKKSGSVCRYDLNKNLPQITSLYQSKELRQYLNELTGQILLDCPDNDPHAYALYYYTEEGDHIGYHYDTSYYKGQRYTLLLGLVDDSSSKLEYHLYKKNQNRETQKNEVSIKPGDLVFFNGDKLYHRITPLGKNQRRIVLTMEFVTNRQMSLFWRFISNMKDSIAYFGFKQVFSKN